VLGRTPAKLFVAGRSLLQVGDQVQFQPISMADFKKIIRVSTKKP